MAFHDAIASENEEQNVQRIMEGMSLGEGTPKRQPRFLQSGFNSLDESQARLLSPVQDLRGPEGWSRFPVSGEAWTEQQRQAFVVPSTEMRQNITKRKSNGRTRDSMDSTTSIPIADLLSRKSFERKKDAAYLQETGLSQRDRITSSYQPASFTPRLGLPQETFDEEWSYLNQISSETNVDSDRRIIRQSQHLEQLDQAASQLPVDSNHLVLVLWFEYLKDEIAVIIAPDSTIDKLVEEAVDILVERGISVSPSQVILRFDGQILDRKANVGEYGIVSEDTVEIHVLPPSGKKASPHRRPVSPAVAPRDIFNNEHERGGKDRGTSATEHTAPRHQSSPDRPLSQSAAPRDIFKNEDKQGEKDRETNATVHTAPQHQSSSDRPSSHSAAPRDIFKNEHEQGEKDRETNATVHTAPRHQSSSSSPVRDIFQSRVSGHQAAPLQDPPRASHLQPSHRPAPNPSSSPNPSRHPPASSNHSPEQTITYYGVRRGHRVGVCNSWEDLQRHIAGFPHPVFRSFTTWQDAKDYVIEGMWRDMPEESKRYASPPPWSSRRFDPPPPDKDRRTENRNIGDEDFSNMGRSVPAVTGISKSQDKIKQNFKCPKFSGNTKDWKIWNKGFIRYLSIWDLEHVLDPSFFDEFPLSDQKVNDNKLVFYILEDATQLSPLAASYVRQAPAKNGFEAYYTLHDGFVFAAATSSTILLNDLANFRFKANETPTELIMRLEELFQELEMLPNGAALIFNDTQRIGYLLGALRHEPAWETVASSITSSQLKGDQTFRQACNELRFRCEADRAYNLMDKSVKTRRQVTALGARAEVAPGGDNEASAGDGSSADSSINALVNMLVSTAAKRLNKDDKDDTNDLKAGRRKHTCLAKGCATKTAFCLCGLHYHSIVSGKSPTLELADGLGVASYNVTTKLIDYPSTIPKDRMPSNKPRAQ